MYPALPRGNAIAVGLVNLSAFRHFFKIKFCKNFFSLKSSPDFCA